LSHIPVEYINNALKDFQRPAAHAAEKQRKELCQLKSKARLP
jgi:hypothetical protein